MTLRTCRASGFVLVMVAISAVARADNWPAFRGPTYNGIAEAKTAPTEWSATENILWKAPLPRPGNGGPIVAEGKVFVTSAEDANGHKRTLFCFDGTTGKQLWSQTVELDRTMPTHKTNPYCGTTPVCDGQRVAVWHASGGLYCYDLEGKELWSRDLGEFRHVWGYGTSPILYGENLILHSGPGERVFVAAFKMSSGETVWSTDEPRDSTGDRNDAGKYQGSWSTPVVAQVDGQDQIIVMMNTRVNAYDPKTGEIIWSCDGLRHDRGDLSYSSPVIAGDIGFVTGGYGGPSFAFRLGGKGDVTEKNRLWRKERQPQSIGSGVYLNGYIYRPNAGPGTVQCIDPESGKELWNDRSGGSQWASLTAVDQLIYATNQDGSTVVFKANPEKFELVAENSLGESCNATPAIADGRIYIRTNEHLWCIGK